MFSSTLKAIANKLIALVLVLSSYHLLLPLLHIIEGQHQI